MPRSFSSFDAAARAAAKQAVREADARAIEARLKSPAQVSAESVAFALPKGQIRVNDAASRSMT